MYLISKINMLAPFILALALTGCGGGGEAPVVAPVVAPAPIVLSSLTATITEINFNKGLSTSIPSYTANYSDNSTKDISDSVVLLSSNEAIFTIDSVQNIIIGQSEGTATLQASYENVTVDVTVEILPPILTSMEITTNTSGEMIVGDTIDLPVVTGQYSDDSTAILTSEAVWTADVSDIVLIESDMITALAEGVVTVTATLGDYSDSESITVTMPTPKYSNVNATIFPTVSIGSKYHIAVSETLSVGLILEDSEGTTFDGLNDLIVAVSDLSILNQGVDGVDLSVTGIVAGDASITLTDPEDVNTETLLEFKVITGSKAFSETFISDKGLEITLTSLSVTDGGSTWDYAISYKQYNPTDIVLGESQWMAFPTTGQGEPQYGGFNNMYPGDTVSRSYTFRFLKATPVKMLQFHSNAFFSRSEPMVDGVVWHLNIASPELN